MKKRLSGFAIIILVLLIFAFPSLANENTDVYLSLQINNPVMTVNGVDMEVDEGRGTAPLIIEGRTLLPIRSVIESFGGVVSWNGETSSVILEIGDDKVELIIGSKVAYYNGGEYTLDVAPQIINDRTMLPVRFIAESFGLGIAWEGDASTVHIVRDVLTIDEAERLESLVPDYSGDAYAVINGNNPFFNDYEFINAPFEYYSNLDEHGRCGVTLASLDDDLMPKEERKSISSVTPTGWINAEYDFISGGYLYNRCHLIGFQLTGENANERNLITGTRYMNIDGMLDFENLVADYIRKNSNHVLYRVTPVYEGDNLIAKGLQMEAYSVEDKGEGVCYNVFVYNSQPGVEIDYSTGESHLSNKAIQKSTKKPQKQPVKKIIGNKNSKTYHQESCSRLPKEQNRIYFNSKEEAKAAGYDNPCGFCNP